MAIQCDVKLAQHTLKHSARQITPNQQIRFDLVY